MAARRRTSLELSIDKIRTYRTQTPYTFFGHKAFTAISYPGDGTKSQPTGNWMRLPMIERSLKGSAISIETPPVGFFLKFTNV
jgi:hypothetical protein